MNHPSALHPPVFEKPFQINALFATCVLISIMHEHDDDVQVRVAKNFWMPLGHHLRFEISLSGKELGAIAGRRGSEDENHCV